MIINFEEMNACRNGLTGNPHQWLGMNKLEAKKGLVVRAWDPGALEVNLFDLKTKTETSMEMLHQSGFFEVFLPRAKEPFPYEFRSFYKDGYREWKDPYSFAPTVSILDLKSFNEGWERRPHLKLGSSPSKLGGIEGVSFVVWAPAALSVHLMGDFNGWNRRSLPMRSLGQTGCRELFVPGARVGQKYKFLILGVDGVLREKTDPFGYRFEPPTGNAAIIQDRFIEKRLLSSSLEKKNPRNSPLSIYEMHLGSWKRNQSKSLPLSYLELADFLPSYLEEMGFSHVEFLPPSEYPYGASWGYQVTGYYAPTFRYGSPEDFLALVQAIKEKGIGVIIDWVPAHFPADEFSLSKFDGTSLFEHEDPRQGRHAEWNTLCFNYGRAEVRSFLIGSAICWLDRFGIDGFRVDAVASMLYLDYGRRDGEWIPNCEGSNENLEAVDFLRQFNQAIHEEYPNVISIAEESTAFPQVTQPPSVGGLGFDFKWNMGWMHDVLNYFGTPPNHRNLSHSNLTFGAMYQFSENFVQVFSHDEVVHGKGSLANKMNLSRDLDKLANLRSLLALQWTWPGKKTLFMGCELGQWNEWDCETEVDWDLLAHHRHKGIKKLVSDLNDLYNSHPTWACTDHDPSKFRWLDCIDADGKTLSFIKYGKFTRDTLVVACNFSDQLLHREWGCPHEGQWEVILDTDSIEYGGEGASGATEFLSFREQLNDVPYGIAFSINRWSVRILSLKD